MKRKPSPLAVIVGSVALFAVLFALIAVQVGTGGRSQTTAQATTTAREPTASYAAPGWGDEDSDGEDPYEAQARAEESYEAPVGEEPHVEEAPLETAPSTRSGGS